MMYLGYEMIYAVQGQEENKCLSHEMVMAVKDDDLVRLDYWLSFRTTVVILPGYS